ncbi:uncharacterized protein G2W53_039416 [Senna tora]|uniref:Uncharacterized protein n=1 Tax=Senna tora TaxID=362788 RepID=A0A834SQP1_9FABA|nr:uncharacterized protein G2W53_039416 [Senna tora]
MESPNKSLTKRHSKVPAYKVLEHPTKPSPRGATKVLAYNALGTK